MLEFELWWLLVIPLFFGLGWLAARIDMRAVILSARKLPTDYFKGLSALVDGDSAEASRRWLEDCGQYYYAYHENGSWYRVWQEDARSLALKGALIRRYDLAGAALWKKGVETPDVWPVVAAAVQ